MLRLLSAFAGVLLACLTPATAEQVGDEVSLRGTILCDTAEQVTHVLIAQQESWEAGSEVFQTFRRTRNHVGDSTCGFMGNPFDVVLGNTVAEFVDVYFPAGLRTVWIVEVKYQHPSGIWMDGAVVLGEPVLVGEGA